MYRLFKKIFIPHPENEHRPHALRTEVMLAVLCVVLIAEIYFLAQAFVFAPFTSLFSSVMPDALLGLANIDRQGINLSELKNNDLLARAAQLKAEDMAAKSYFAHTSPDGLTPWHWLEQVGYSYSYAGENLAINFMDSKDIENAWMNSPAHRANILNGSFSEVGIGTAKGIYQNKETIFVVQLLAKPAQSIVLSAKVFEPVATQFPLSGPVAASPAPLPSQAAVLAEEDSSLPELNSEASILPPEPTITVSPDLSNETLIQQDQAPPDNSDKSLISGFLSATRKKLSEPRAMTNFLYVVLLTIISLALVLKIFVKIKIQHPDLIFNGVFLLLVISSIFWLNQFIALNPAKIL